ncbi:MAG: extracellular solute-binding protein [Candidatus Bathyarchaeia archaeon]
MSEEKKEAVSRRGFVKTAGAGIVGLVVGAGIGYGASQMAGAPSPGVAPTVTVTKPGEMAFPFNLPRKGDTPADRAINAAKFLLENHPEWKGTELVLACVGGYQVGFEAMRKRWESETGTKVTIATTPLPEYFDKMMVEAVTKTGAIDLLNIQPMHVSDLAEAGLLYQLDDVSMWLDALEHGKPYGYVYPLEYFIPRYKGKLYGLVQDGDVATLYYRTDWMNDPKEKEGFEKQYGYPLAPAKTILEYRDQAAWFYRPNEKKYGFVEYRELTRNANKFYCYFNSKKWPNNYYFDDDMKPQLTTKEGIEAATIYVEMMKYGPPDLPALLGVAPATYFAEGKAFESINFPSFANLIQVEGAASRNKWDTAPVPGWYVDGPDGKKILNRRSVNLASWSLAVSNHSKKRDLACCLAVYMADPWILLEGILQPGTWHDMSRYCHVGLAAPAKLKDRRGPLLSYFEENASVLTPMVTGLIAATEYNVTLSKNLHAAMVGTMDPVKALETTEKQWEEITNRVGREKQIAAWKELKKWYPTTVI